MPRSKINSQSKDLITDDGSVLISVIKGEQIQLDITLGWLTNLTGFTITAKIVEADSSSYPTTAPTAIHPTSGIHPIVTPLTVANGLIIDATTTDNTFKVVIPETLIDSYTTQPLPDKPVYAWFGLEVKDTGAGAVQQVWKPMRGLVKIYYSPTEA